MVGNPQAFLAAIKPLLSQARPNFRIAIENGAYEKGGRRFFHTADDLSVVLSLLPRRDRNKVGISLHTGRAQRVEKIADYAKKITELSPILNVHLSESIGADTNQRIGTGSVQYRLGRLFNSSLALNARPRSGQRERRGPPRHPARHPPTVARFPERPTPRS